MDKAEDADARTSAISEKTTGAAALVMIWCGSTEVFHKPGAVHQTLEISSAGCKRTIPTSRPARSTRTPR